MALVGDVLYVADTENHLLRKVDLAAKQVTTVAGTGEKGSAWPAFGERSRSLNRCGAKPRRHERRRWPARGRCGITATICTSRWPGRIRFGRCRSMRATIGPYAGNGREDIVDGPLLPSVPYDADYASFAQPSGLTSDGKRLFVADSEGSTIRAVPFDPNGKVETLVGLTGTLFDFGDVDGNGRDVRLQHPLGVAWWDGKLYVADTYNNKIKVIDVEQRTCHTIAGSGKAGQCGRRGRAQGDIQRTGRNFGGRRQAVRRRYEQSCDSRRGVGGAVSGVDA